MRNLAAFLVLSCLIACVEVSAVQEEPKKQEPDRMKGVKRVIECQFDVNLDGPDETLTTKQTTIYNDHGDATEVQIVHRGETFVETYEYEYDAKGRTQTRIFRLGGALHNKSTFSYTADGGFIRSYILYEGKEGKEQPVCAGTEEYNARGLKTSVALNNAKGPATPRWTFRYDEKGRLTEERLFRESSPFPEVTSYSYEEKGAVLLKTAKSDEDGAELEKTEYKLNERGDPTITRHLGNGEKEHRRIEASYVYDHEGRVLIRTEEKIHGIAPYMRKRWTYQYDLFEEKK